MSMKASVAQLNDHGDFTRFARVHARLTPLESVGNGLGLSGCELKVTAEDFHLLVGCYLGVSDPGF